YIDEVTIETGNRVVSFPDDFERGVGDWCADYGIWEVGVPTSGPGGAHSGSNVLATILVGNYYDNRSSRISTPPFVVPSADQQPRLRFWHWWSFSCDDYGQVQIRVDGGPWQALSADGIYTADSSGNWTRACLDLSPYSGQTVQLGF